MCKWSAVPTVLETQEQELKVVGLQSSKDLVSTTLDLSLVLEQRTLRLLKEGLIKYGEEFWVQVIADASGIFTSTRTNETVVVLEVKFLRISDAICIARL
jgi:hypothetical protein